MRMTYGTAVRVHHSAATLKKPSGSLFWRKPGRTFYKIHALTDNYGLPEKLVITPGQTHDIPVAAELSKKRA